MTGTVCNTEGTLICAPTGIRELTRGHEGPLQEWLSPQVRQRNVTLDLGSVERIDAAGISALISLYKCAREAGHCFTISKVSPRVAGILELVGLDRALLSHMMVEKPYTALHPERPAA